jgi:hypothetical protein
MSTIDEALADYIPDDVGDLDADQLEDAEHALPGRRALVTLPGGEAFTVRVTNRELVLWDKTAPRHKWGAAQDVPFLARSFTAWAAATRDGLTAMRFEAWNDAPLMIEDLAEDGTDAARPTRKAPGAASS